MPNWKHRLGTLNSYGNRSKSRDRDTRCLRASGPPACTPPAGSNTAGRRAAGCTSIDSAELLLCLSDGGRIVSTHPNMTTAAANDKTGSIFITKAGFDAAASDAGLDATLAATFWSKLAEGSSQRIIGGATAPREDAANVNQWHWSESDLAPWAKERLEGLLVGKIAAQGVPDKGWVKVTKMEVRT